MRFATAEETRALDAAALGAAAEIPGAPPDERLMRLVATAVADAAEDIARRLPHAPEILAICGGGDNGRDARLASAELARRGWRASAHRVGDALPPPAALPRCAIALDGVLGIGMRGAPRPDAAVAIDWLRRFRGEGGAVTPPARRLVLAVDLPSGMPADGGVAPGPCVEADFTVTAGLPKLAFWGEEALSRCGEILVADIGYGREAERGRRGERELATLQELHRVLPPRRRDAHKGDFGHVAVVAGSVRYPGAPLLAILGALRGGAGLVSAFVPTAVADAAAVRTPEVMAAGWGPGVPVLSPKRIAALPFPLGGKTLCVGPGLGRAPETVEAVEAILGSSGPAGFVLDADALLPELLPAITRAAGHVPVVLTPHSGEAARLLGTTAADVQRNRPECARALMRLAGGATVLLKGAGSIAISPRSGPTLVPAGNPALARGGSGDLLAGLCAALLARGAPPHEAAWGAALLHGRAADLAAIARGPEPVLPSELANELWN